jgi:hypothetical protein
MSDLENLMQDPPLYALASLHWFGNFDAGIVSFPPVHEEVAANFGKKG